MALIQSARWVEAREVGREFCRVQDNDPEAWFLLGAIHGQLGDWAEAERCSDKAVALAPGVSAAHFNLGVARLHQRKPGAAASFRTTLVLQPDHPAARGLLKEACVMEGLLLSESGNLEGAIAFLTYVLHDAESAGIRMLLGESCSRTNRRHEALIHYRRACELDPGNVRAHVGLADIIMQGDPGRSDWDEVIGRLQTATRLEPDNPAAHAKLATALDMRGRYGEAIEEYAKALALAPGNPAAIWGLVRTYEGMGRLDEAEKVLRPWLDRAATAPAIALAYGIMAPHLNETQAAIAALRNAMALPGVTREIESTIRFQLGELLDKTGEYDEAFRHYRHGNMLRTVAYDHMSQTRQFDALIEFFSRERLPRLPRAANVSKLPVFIVGMPRSGTTLVETILASHPQVHGAGELEDILHMRLELQNASGDGTAYPGCLETMSFETLNRFSSRHLEKLGSLEPGVVRVTDKMPQNFINLGLIDLLFPGARVIHCMRSPMDACLSIYFHPLMKHHDYASDLEHIGLYYREYRRLMAHWRKVLRIPMLDLRYEELVTSPEEKVRQLLEFCELPWDERCLRHHESGRIAKTFSYNQVRQPIYRTSVARWKRYETHLGPLIQALGDACDTLSSAA